MNDNIPQINEEQLDAVGIRIFKLYQTHKTDRRAAEDRWLQNIRQFRGIYDPEVLSMIAKDQSKAYPKLTRKVIIGTVARLMQMLFPQTEENFGVTSSPMPSLSTEQLQEVLDKHVQEKLAILQQQNPQATVAEVECTDEEIEKAIYDYASHKATRMELKIKDDLKEMEYITLARRVVFSAVLYNMGLLVGPYNKTVKARTWKKNPFKGTYEAQEVTRYKPIYEFRSVWDHYPDMTAKTLDQQDGAFDRHIMTRAQVEALVKRPDFMSGRINEWLNKNATGNYKPEWWETILQTEPKSDKKFVPQPTDRKYELASYWGGVTGHELRAAGVTIPEENIGKTFQANVWTIENKVIKSVLSPYDDSVRHHHYFIFEEDDLSLLGNGQADTMRDSQLSLCETTRAALDNSSVVGPNIVVNEDRLVAGQDLTVRKHKTWRIEDMPAGATIDGAVKNLTIDSHIGELLALRKAILDFSSDESGLPPPSLGDVSQGGSEALRTQGGASMFLGAAALPIRDTVRNFDSFTMSVIGTLVKWNQKFDPNPSRDGDHDVIARGSTSLIAKEVLAGSLDAVRKTVTPDEAPHINTRKLLILRLKARDVPTDDILEDEDKANATVQHNAEMQQQVAQGQMKLVEAQVHDALAKAVANIAKAHKDDASIVSDAAALLLEALQTGHKNAITEQVANSPKGGASGSK